AVPRRSRPVRIADPLAGPDSGGCRHAGPAGGRQEGQCRAGDAAGGRAEEVGSGSGPDRDSGDSGPGEARHQERQGHQEVATPGGWYIPPATGPPTSPAGVLPFSGLTQWGLQALEYGIGLIDVQGAQLAQCVFPGVVAAHVAVVVLLQDAVPGPSLTDAVRHGDTVPSVIEWVLLVHERRCVPPSIRHGAGAGALTHPRRRTSGFQWRGSRLLSVLRRAHRRIPCPVPGSHLFHGPNQVGRLGCTSRYRSL